MAKAVYINLPTKDVAAARTFYADLGFKIDEEYSTEQNVFIWLSQNVQLIIADTAFLRESEQRAFADTSKFTEVSVTIELDSREEVDKMFDAGLAGGGKQAGKTVEIAEIGMYSRGLTDLDGHRLDFLCMSM